MGLSVDSFKRFCKKKCIKLKFLLNSCDIGLCKEFNQLFSLIFNVRMIERTKKWTGGRLHFKFSFRHGVLFCSVFPDNVVPV